VQSISFTVSRGSIHGFVGPNGAGKTTTLKVIATLLKPTSGSIRVLGYNTATSGMQVRRKIGYMPDHFSMYRQMTVFEYLDFFGAAYGIPQLLRDKTIAAVLDLTDMAGRKQDFIGGLSRGMQQRVALARVLVHDPDLLLLDEPASGLDPRARIELMEILRELQAMNKTVFISSHILSELAELCDEVTIVDRGTVQYTGRMDALIRHGDHTQASYILRVGGCTEIFEAGLRGLAGVEQVEGLEEGGGSWRYTVTGAAETLVGNAVLTYALGQGVPILEFKENVRHLNEVFMDLTEPGVRT
jgi:ABC-2 type transport system ATP-binding protein